MYSCVADGRNLILTGEENSKGYFRCPKCKKRYAIDLRDGSIIEIVFENGSGIRAIKSSDNVRGKQRI